VRLFVALAISQEVRERIAQLVRELCGYAPRAKWIRGENLHVTVKFLGENPASKLEAISGALRMVCSSGPVAMHFRGLGFFPSEERAKVLWAGVGGSENLPALAADIERSLAELGFPAEQRRFEPHLTLARFEPAGVPPKLKVAAAKSSAQDFGVVQAREFHLMESKLKPTGAEYTTLQSFPFRTEN
jgi:RNA 2',3'-cyclic 3'-phosphodiesterase